MANPIAQAQARGGMRILTPAQRNYSGPRQGAAGAKLGPNFGVGAGLRGFQRGPGFRVNPGGAINRARQQGQGFGGGAQSTLPRTGTWNMGGGQGFRHLANTIAKRPSGGGVIQLGGRGINPMRHPGALATTAGRRAANSGQPNPIDRARQVAQRSYAPPPTRRQNPISRARQQGRGF